MRVLDLFSGLGGWSTPFRERGHEVVTVDIEERFEPSIVADVLELPDDLGKWWLRDGFDVICASPPCEKFSVLALGHHWLPGYVPKHEGTLHAMELVRKTVRIIEATKPAFWVIENPVGMLRKLHLIPYERQTVTYCQYGARYRKPTDLWGGFPPSLTLRRRCKNGDPCHVSSPRGSTTGVQGDGQPKIRQKDGSRLPVGVHHLTKVKRELREHFGTSNQRDLAALRAKIPHDLALDLCIAAERDLAAGLRASDYTGALFA